MTLREVFQTMHRLLRREISPAEASARLGCEEARIAPYPEFVLDHVRDILLKNFSVLAGLFAAEEWEAIVREYFQAHPPDHYERNANAAHFPSFLHAMAREGHFGIGEFHLELAEVEWQEWVAFSSPKRIPLSTEIQGPALNPTLTVLDLDFPVVTYMRIWEKERATGFPHGVPPVPGEKNGEIAFVFRHPQRQEAVVQRTRDTDLFAFKVIHDGIPLHQAAEEAGIDLSEARAILRDAEVTGLVILPCAP